MRPRTIILPLVVIGLAIGGWSGVWAWGSNRAEDAIQRWLAAEAANGRVIQCGERSRGGYPFRMEITCSKPMVELRDEARPYQTYRFETLKVVSQIWSPGHVISEWTGPMTVVTEGDPSVTTATWRLAQASAQLQIGGYDSSNAVIDGLEVVRDGVVRVKAARSELHTRPNRTDPVSIDVVASLKQATFAARPMAPVDAEIQFVARKLLRTPSRPQVLPVRQWMAAGGAVDLVLLRLVQGPAVAVAKGTLRLTPEGKPDGEIELRVANVEAALQATGLGATLGPLAAGAITMASRPTDVEGKPGRIFTLRAADGRLQVGPLRIGLPTIVP
jgi:hypothetical protein